MFVGGGQAGLAMSEHLSRCGISHLVLERNRIAERWRSERWDSLVATARPGMTASRTWNFPIATRTPSLRKKRSRITSSPMRTRFPRHPLRCGGDRGQAQHRPARVSYRNLNRPDRSRLRDRGHRRLPAPGHAGSRARPGGITQMHSAAYRNPGQLPDGAVLVVGAGSSGAQIAADCLRQARVSISRSARMTARRAAIAAAISSGGWGS